MQYLMGPSFLGSLWETQFQMVRPRPLDLREQQQGLAHPVCQAKWLGCELRDTNVGLKKDGVWTSGPLGILQTWMR